MRRWVIASEQNQLGQLGDECPTAFLVRYGVENLLAEPHYEAGAVVRWEAFHSGRCVASAFDAVAAADKAQCTL